MLGDNPVVNISSDQSEIDTFIEEVIKDFRICCISREVSLLARKEVLTGKAKFGITGDGKEVPQVAMARAFKKGDWRSGYYRDQTLMFALGLTTIEQYFAQLYADAQNDPFSGGRQMNSHFATPMYDAKGEWANSLEQYNTSSDISSTGGQMGRAVGLALASKIYRQEGAIQDERFSNDGQEVCFCTIGDASTSEGVFWEAVNAAGVQQIPLAISVWDDGYGISVPKAYQTTKQSISEVLAGFQKNGEDLNGLDIYQVNGWDYPKLCEVYEKGIEKVRRTHVPALFHVEELTQPQGHSTSGSHERYKDKERLEWERQHDCIEVMYRWMIDAKIADAKTLDKIWADAKKEVKEARERAWKAYVEPINAQIGHLDKIYTRLIDAHPDEKGIAPLHTSLTKMLNPVYSEIVQNARQVQMLLRAHQSDAVKELREWLISSRQLTEKRYSHYLYSESPKSALRVPIVPARFSEESPTRNGYQVLNRCFDDILQRDKRVYAFGEDVGQIGDVNQGFAGLQEKHGKERVFDTGIREWTIMGQAIGMAMRGLRPIAEIQYLDYLVYGLEPLTDDLATLRYRSNNLQQSPAIIRTRGHRLEGIWHAGSPIGMLINSLRGIYICVPRDMTQAAGFYNTMLQSDDPALIIECLNGYRLKERLPDNISEFTVPLGVPEVLEEGTDVTLVTYGACVRVTHLAQCTQSLMGHPNTSPIRLWVH